MGALATLDANACERLRERLKSLDGVIRAVVEGGGETIWLVSEPQSESRPLEAAAGQVLASVGVDPASARIRVATATGVARERVRFREIERRLEHAGMARVRVTLEWQGETFDGEAAGETGPAVELRTAAAAALSAVHAILGDERRFRLTGVKPIRAFDTDLVVVSIYRSGPEPKQFVGAVLATPDPLHGAARAVLHALNRTLGNFLNTPD